MTAARVRLLPEAADDVRALDGSARRIVLKGLKKLEESPELCGAPLGSKANAQSDLTGFRKIVVGDRAHRIVYQVLPDGTVVVVWIVGARADEEVYRLALDRIAAYDDPARRALLRAILDASG
ncbi:MAG: type II toxin-antitoxin system RelE/ParE family toxin [Protaetiibacter sp.]